MGADWAWIFLIFAAKGCVAGSAKHRVLITYSFAHLTYSLTLVMVLEESVCLSRPPEPPSPHARDSKRV